MTPTSCVSQMWITGTTDHVWEKGIGSVTVAVRGQAKALRNRKTAAARAAEAGTVVTQAATMVRT